MNAILLECCVCSAGIVNFEMSENCKNLLILLFICAIVVFVTWKTCCYRLIKSFKAEKDKFKLNFDSLEKQKNEIEKSLKTERAKNESSERAIELLKCFVSMVKGKDEKPNTEMIEILFGEYKKIKADFEGR